MLGLGGGPNFFISEMNHDIDDGTYENDVNLSDIKFTPGTNHYTYGLIVQILDPFGDESDSNEGGKTPKGDMIME